MYNRTWKGQASLQCLGQIFFSREARFFVLGALPWLLCGGAEVRRTSLNLCLTVHRQFTIKAKGPLNFYHMEVGTMI